MRVGVRLDVGSGALGEWLADAAAFDAGGADALWLDCGPEPELDVLTLAAALAVVTFRARLVVVLPGSGIPPGGLVLETVGLLSRGRLALVTDLRRGERLPAGVGAFRRIPGEPAVFEAPDAGARDAGNTDAEGPDARARDTGGPDAEGLNAGTTGAGTTGAGDTGAGDTVRRWELAPVPDGRAAWRATRAEAAERGTYGIVVPADPRVLDLLRNPDDPEERYDLLLAQG